MKLIPALLAATLALAPTQAKATDDPLETFVALRATTLCGVYTGTTTQTNAVKWEVRMAAKQGLTRDQYLNYNQQSDTGWLKAMIYNVIESAGGCSAVFRKVRQSMPASVYR